MKCFIILVSLAVVMNAAEIPGAEVTAKVPLIADKEKVTTPIPVAVPVPVHTPHIVSDKDKPVVPPKQPVNGIIDHGEHKVPTIPPHVQHVVEQVNQHVPQVINHHVGMIKSMHEHVTHQHPDQTTTSSPIPVHHVTDKVPHHGQPIAIHVDIIHQNADGHKHTAHNVPHGAGVGGVHQHLTVPQAVINNVHKVEQHIQQVMQQAQQKIPQLINQQIAQQKDKHHVGHHMPTTHVPHVTPPVSVPTPVESIEPVVPAVVPHPIVNVEKPAVM